MHLDLEKDLAAFMGTEASIIYSYDIATASRQTFRRALLRPSSMVNGFGRPL